MTENRFVERYAGRTIKKLIGIEDTETNRVCVTIEENILLLNELADENKELKEENEKLKNRLKFFMELNKPYGDIIKENEQLQKQLSDVRKENYGNLDGINYYQEQNASLSERISDLKCENEQLKQFIQELTTKGTGKIHLANGNIYKVNAILTDFKR